jgi:uncharacterized protein YndB with AHSA1/START domain
MRPHTETYEIVGAVPGWVHGLERRWQEEDARARVYVRPEESIIGTTYEVAAPPAVAWEFLTAPGKRVQWMAGVTDVVQDAEGGRRGVGSTNHCMHGKDAVVEEVLDWRPFDYYTFRSTVHTPAGPIGIVNTVEIEPTATGSRISVRFQQPNPDDAAILEPMIPMFQGMVDVGAAALRELLANEGPARADATPPEPELPKPDPVGAFANLPPIRILS